MTKASMCGLAVVGLLVVMAMGTGSAWAQPCQTPQAGSDAVDNGGGQGAMMAPGGPMGMGSSCHCPMMQGTPTTGEGAASLSDGQMQQLMQLRQSAMAEAQNIIEQMDKTRERMRQQVAMESPDYSELASLSRSMALDIGQLGVLRWETMGKMAQVAPNLKPGGMMGSGDMQPNMMPGVCCPMKGMGMMKPRTMGSDGTESGMMPGMCCPMGHMGMMQPGMMGSDGADSGMMPGMSCPMGRMGMMKPGMMGSDGTESGMMPGMSCPMGRMGMMKPGMMGSDGTESGMMPGMCCPMMRMRMMRSGMMGTESMKPDAMPGMCCPMMRMRMMGSGMMGSGGMTPGPCCPMMRGGMGMGPGTMGEGQQMPPPGNQ